MNLDKIKESLEFADTLDPEVSIKHYANILCRIMLSVFEEDSEDVGTVDVVDVWYRYTNKINTSVDSQVAFICHQILHYGECGSSMSRDKVVRILKNSAHNALHEVIEYSTSKKLNKVLTTVTDACFTVNDSTDFLLNMDSALFKDFLTDYADVRLQLQSIKDDQQVVIPVVKKTPTGIFTITLYMETKNSNDVKLVITRIA